MTASAIARYISDFERDGGLRGTDIANVTGVSRATVSRWRAGTARPQPANQRILADLHYVVDRLGEYYTAEEIRLWLYAPHAQLDGRRAIDVVHQGGLTEVLQVLDRLEVAAYL